MITECSLYLNLVPKTKKKCLTKISILHLTNPTVIKTTIVSQLSVFQFILMSSHLHLTRRSNLCPAMCEREMVGAASLAPTCTKI